LLAECLIRNTRSVVSLSLPRRTAQTVRLDPAPGEAVLYAAVSDFVRRRSADDFSRLALRTLQMEAGSSPQAVLSTLRRLMAQRPAHGAGDLQALMELAEAVPVSAKEEALLHLLDATPEKVLVFSKYLATLDRLADLLRRRGISYDLYHGSLAPAEKDRAIVSFEGSTRVLLASEAAGEGRNLQFCRLMVNYDLPWNPMRIEQRVGRIHRIGQQREVSIYNLVARGSVEDHVLRVLDEKINLFELVVGEVGMILGDLDEERDFEEIVLDLWITSRDDAEFGRRLDSLGDRLSEARASYLRAREMDQEIFGDDLAAT
jgi:SNF2 family DNA or RNA helicase